MSETSVSPRPGAGLTAAETTPWKDGDRNARLDAHPAAL